MRRLYFPLLFLAACATSNPAQDMERLRDIHRQRFEAMVRQDFNALERLMSDDVVYVHSDAVVETKQEFIQKIHRGEMRYRAIDAPDPVIRIYGDTAVITGQGKFSVTRGGADREIDARYTAVYQRAGRTWRLVSWQSTRLP